MNREEFTKKVIEKIEKQLPIPKSEMENSKKYGTSRKAIKINGCRQGVYFLYNTNKEIIYIGKVGTKKKTSLYHRMKGHGSGAHNKQSWYAEVDFGKYIIFDKLNDFEIEVIERLCIMYNPNKDNYNDKYFNDTIIDEINGKI